MTSRRITAYGSNGDTILVLVYHGRYPGRDLNPSNFTEYELSITDARKLAKELTTLTDLAEETS